MTINELVDFCTANCEMKRLFRLIVKSKGYFIGIEWLMGQEGCNVNSIEMLKTMVNYASDTLSEFQELRDVR